MYMQKAICIYMYMPCMYMYAARHVYMLCIYMYMLCIYMYIDVFGQVVRIPDDPPPFVSSFFWSTSPN